MSGPGGIISDLYSGAASASYSFADVSPPSPVSPDYYTRLRKQEGKFTRPENCLGMRINE